MTEEKYKVYPEPTQESIQDSTQESTKPIINKIVMPGRTILVKSTLSDGIDLSNFDKFVGLLNTSEIKNNNTVFLTFNTILNSEAAYKVLELNYIIKYSYYKIFVTLSTNVTSSDYDKTKNEITSFIESKTDCSMLYCKFYRKGDEYMNCGDLIVDSLDGMNKLISKNSTLKQFKTDNYSGTFFRFNNSNNKFKKPVLSQSAY